MTEHLISLYTQTFCHQQHLADLADWGRFHFFFIDRDDRIGQGDFLYSQSSGGQLECQHQATSQVQLAIF
jgi:hypothetical protein